MINQQHHRNQISTSPSDILPAEAEQRLRQIIRQWGEALYKHVRRILVNHADAQDAVQETFIKVYRHIGKLREPQALKVWLYRIASNEALRIIEARKKTVAVDYDLDAASYVVSDTYIDYTNLEAVQLQKAIQQLPPKQQSVFLLRYYDDFSFAEIAEITGCSADTAKVNYHFAKNKIIEYFRNYEN